MKKKKIQLFNRSQLTYLAFMKLVNILLNVPWRISGLKYIKPQVGILQKKQKKIRGKNTAIFGNSLYKSKLHGKKIKVVAGETQP